MWLPSIGRRTVELDPKTLTALVERLGRLTSSNAPAAVVGKPRRAAVLVPLCLSGAAGLPSVLFNLRSSSVRTHAGQVSFPGGKEEPGDEGDLEKTALRETREEMGIAESRVRVLGRLEPVRSLHGLAVTPYVGYVGRVDLAQDPLVASEEIAETFAVPIKKLFEPDGWRRDEAGVRLMRYVAAAHPIWGLTGYITVRLLQELQMAVSETEPASEREPASVRQADGSSARKRRRSVVGRVRRSPGAGDTTGRRAISMCAGRAKL